MKAAIRHRSAPARPVVEHVPGLDGLRALDAFGWDDLLAATGVDDPTRRIHWMVAETPTEARVHTVAIREGDQLQAGLALEVTRRLGIRYATDLGAERTWFRLEPPGTDAAATRLLLAALRDTPIDLLVLGDVAMDSPRAHQLRERFPNLRFEPAPHAHLLDLSAGSRRLTKRRAETRRSERRAADAGIDVHVRTIDAWPRIADELDEMLSFHTRHFRGGTTNNLAGDPGARQRVRRALEGVAARDGVRLTTVRDQRRLLSFAITLIDSRTAYGYATGFDESEARVPGLGWMAMIAAMDAAREEGATVFNLGSGSDGSYKALVADPIPRHRALIPLTTVGRVALATKPRRAGAR